MTRVDVTQDEVLDKIVKRLRVELELNDRQCYETLDALAPPRIPKGGEHFIAVAPGEGVFVTGEQAAGNITEEWFVTVTIYTRIALDPTDHDEQLLRNKTRGLFVLKKSVLKALCGHDMVDEDGNEFLRQWIHAIRCKRPEVIVPADGGTSHTLGILSIDFGIPWDWDIT